MLALSHAKNRALAIGYSLGEWSSASLGPMFAH